MGYCLGWASNGRLVDGGGGVCEGGIAGMGSVHGI